ncbi:MAG: GntR family transcriptional regulator [Clostridiales bacterium]|nr:GntR family transcriptional regulator [Clostridiales bacterium]
MIDKTCAKPLHRQMEEAIRRRLHTGEWAPGAPIPSENELGNENGISRMTVRNVITKLVQEGLLFRIAGKGTFVSEEKIDAKSLFYEGIREQLERLGYEVTTELLGVKACRGTKDVRQKLALGAEEKVYVIQRRRGVKGKPLSLHISYIPEKLAPGLENQNLVEEQLCTILSKQYGLTRSRVYEELESVAASKTEADLLDIPAGHPLLLLQDTLVDKYGVPFEFAKVIFRGDKLKLRLEF